MSPLNIFVFNEYLLAPNTSKGNLSIPYNVVNGGLSIQLLDSFTVEPALPMGQRGRPPPPHLSHLVVWPWRLAVSLCFHIFSTAPPPVWTNCNFSPWFSWEFLLSRCEGLREEDVVMMLMLCKALWDKLFVKTGYKNKIALPCLTRLDCNSYSCY